ncbi:MAG TPA: alternative ribosome rescue aminoacyl-tRNA hydrolase ArfB [Salinisphaeraceae bacterium]|nr:alternative ribosome rescue aminoacyl-tRNA hydrolase ArfB [Salinisphaeraceae bacterium]
MYINKHLQLDERELEERFVRASGPGGQHVNTAATAVQLRFDAARSASLSAAVRARLLAMPDPHITADGVIVIFAQRYRSQASNRRDARARLARLLTKAARAPARRRPTRVPRRAKMRRLENKKRRGRKKQLRKKPPLE